MIVVYDNLSKRQLHTFPYFFADHPVGREKLILECILAYIQDFF